MQLHAEQEALHPVRPKKGSWHHWQLFAMHSEQVVILEHIMVVVVVVVLVVVVTKGSVVVVPEGIVLVVVVVVVVVLTRLCISEADNALFQTFTSSNMPSK